MYVGRQRSARRTGEGRMRSRLTGGCLARRPGTHFVGAVWNHACTKSAPHSFQQNYAVMKFRTAVFLMQRLLPRCKQDH